MSHSIPTNRPQTADFKSASLRRGFTLIELVVVMTLLTVVFAVISPSLAQFFRGRDLNSEANRLLSLTRYGQSRAVSEGIPMVLWIDKQRGQYGLQAEATFVPDDSQKEQFSVAANLQLDVQQPFVSNTSGQWWQMMSSGSLQSILWGQPQDTSGSSLPRIRFTPDGQISATSPEAISIRDTRDKAGKPIWVARSRSGLSYEIRTDTQQMASR